MPPADSELNKAAETLRKIVLFLQARSRWSVDHDGRGALQEISAGADRCQRVLEMRLGAFDLQSPPPVEPPSTMPKATLDAPRLRRFAGWLGDLAFWLEARPAGDPDEEARQITAEIVADLGRLRAATAELCPPPPSLPEPAPAREAPPEPRSPEPVEVPPVPPLVLRGSIQEPLLHEKGGSYELTAHARRRLVEFLEASAIDCGGANLRRLEVKITRWIEATPEGQALVLKVGGLHGRREPFPAYVSAERATQLEAQQQHVS